MRIAVLALQGAFAEHRQKLAQLGVDSFEVRQLKDWNQPKDGLIIPGGESTTQSKLLNELGLMEPVKEAIAAGLPVYGTCAGLILLAKKIEGEPSHRIASMDITALRNAYGRQLGSFYIEAPMKGIEGIKMAVKEKKKKPQVEYEKQPESPTKKFDVTYAIVSVIAIIVLFSVLVTAYYKNNYIMFSPENVAEQYVENTAENDGYDAVQLGFMDAKAKQTTKAEKGHFEKNQLSVKKHLKEFRFDDCSGYNVGDVITVDTFAAGDKVDVTGMTKGHGFSGVVKRWGCHKLRMTHGVGPVHRQPGSMGANSTPSRIYKNKRMAGQYGNVQVTVQNLKVVRIDTEKNLIAIKGAVPGAKDGIVFVRNSVKA